MTTVYVVTSGEYSDYGIDAMFDSKELAEAFIASQTCKYCISRIEEYPLNKYVNLDYDYLVKYSSWKSPEYQWSIDKEDPQYVADDQEFNKVEATEPDFIDPEDRARFYGSKLYTVWVKAKTRDAALKIANEKIMMAIAGGMQDEP